ncbi:MAG: DNA primase [Phycisphaerae bacterium]|nr:DNA primase [Phycisphaerae bacterium]
MPRFSDQFIQQVAQATDLVDLVGQYVALKKRGAEFVGLCPFHSDKNPSMYVSPAKQIFKCFACGAGGGVFKFIELHERLTFPEAVKFLAERAHIPLPRDVDPPPPDGTPTKQDLHRITQFAADYFHRSLLGPFGRSTLDYAHKRGLTDAAIEQFHLGFSPELWDGLLKDARRVGIGEQGLLAAGLVISRESGGCYDRFRNRLMFPICDVGGNVIAFGGRALDPNDKAKYLNSPEGLLYDKSANLYGLNWARQAISAREQAVVVEGYMDCVVPHQAGVTNVVANLGTALTERQVKLLSRYAKEVVLIYDADAAGQAATERALEMFLAQQLHVRVATIPDGKDPCDFTLAHGGEAMRALIDDAPDALAYAWRRRAAALESAGDNLAKRRVILEDFLRLVVHSSAFGAIDEVRRGQLAQHIAHVLNLSAAEVQQHMRRMSRTIPRANPVANDSASRGPADEATAPTHNLKDETGPTYLIQRHLLEALLNEPERFDGVAERVGPDDFEAPTLRRIAVELWSRGATGHLVTEELLACEALADAGALLADMIDAGMRRGNHEQTLAGAVETLTYWRDRRTLHAMKDNGLDDDTLRQLTQQYKKADPGRRRPRIG